MERIELLIYLIIVAFVIGLIYRYTKKDRSDKQIH
jgi:hypothetical protein